MLKKRVDIRKNEYKQIMDLKMKRFLFLAVALVLCGIVNVQAAGDEKNGHAYFTKAQLPNMANILPAPPEFESARFVADQSQLSLIHI